MDQDSLDQTPTDLYLRRLSLEYSVDDVRELAMQLGLPYEIWDGLYSGGRMKPESLKFEALRRCRDMFNFTFRQIEEAVIRGGIQSPDVLYRVIQNCHSNFEDKNNKDKWDQIPTDSMIDKLAPLVGSNSLQFLVELGLTFQLWEQIEYRQSERDLVKLNSDIMKAWKNNCKQLKIKPTLKTIGQAFGNIGINIQIIENALG